MSEHTPILRLVDVHIERGGTVIVDDVAWTIERGQNWAVLGANGSGKTSLLSAIMGYLPATRGDIEVLGQRYGGADWREMRQRIGIVSTALSPMLESGEPAWKTILSGKNALLGYYGEPAPEDVERALGILVQLEAGHLETRRWGVLSQGERQRVLIGRALMGRPELLILDEPCAGLDPVARERFLGFLDGWVGRGDVPAIVLVTHHVEEITASFSHALVLRRGRVVARGPKEEVLGSEILSRAFDAPVQVSSSGGRYTLVIG